MRDRLKKYKKAFRELTMHQRQKRGVDSPEGNPDMAVTKSNQDRWPDDNFSQALTYLHQILNQ
eukprot:14622855-Ditylum_brightwellii.AAC.1